jgi:hypothetical protein
LEAFYSIWPKRYLSGEVSNAAGTRSGQRFSTQFHIKAGPAEKSSRPGAKSKVSLFRDGDFGDCQHGRQTDPVEFDLEVTLRIFHSLSFFKAKLRRQGVG